MKTNRIHCAWVIDDDPLQVLILNRLLSTNQNIKSSRFFSGGKSAIEVLGNNKNKPEELPDLIFLDIMMSRGDGWEFLDYYKKASTKLSRQAQIILMSSSNDDYNKKIKQYPEVVQFVSKPIDKKRFEIVLDQIISSQLHGTL